MARLLQYTLAFQTQTDSYSDAYSMCTWELGYQWLQCTCIVTY